MNDVAMWVEPLTAMFFLNCDSGCREKISSLLSQLKGGSGKGCRSGNMLPKNRWNMFPKCPIGEISLHVLFHSNKNSDEGLSQIITKVTGAKDFPSNPTLLTIVLSFTSTIGDNGHQDK
ncbi:hypothetical protein AB205_0088590 [Aquarana catesbeiana]|uniref:Uncharacterized protein n=1 Tax=Aquarana catesbeiana TaxID=8400 RepID=A0A2G9SAS2_AQUCT|nr:hypothetical protein AB205_0088590 [Aquarana catesbeiana]